MAAEEGVHGSIELVPALEEIELHHEEEAEELAAELLDEIAGRSCSAACITFQSVLSPQSSNSYLLFLPVAMISSTMTTFCPGLIASLCI